MATHKRLKNIGLDLIGPPIFGSSHRTQVVKVPFSPYSVIQKFPQLISVRFEDPSVQYARVEKSISYVDNVDPLLQQNLFLLDRRHILKLTRDYWINYY